MTGLLGQDVKGLEQLCDPVQRKEAGIHWDDRFRARLQRVEGEETDARRAIDDDIVVIVGEAGQRVGQDVFPTDLTSERLRHPAQQDVGGSHIEVLANIPNDVTENGGPLAGLLDEDLVHRPRRLDRVGEKPERRMALRVHVHEQDSALLAGEKGREVDGCDGLSTPALLVHDRYRAHSTLLTAVVFLPQRPDGSKRGGGLITF